MEKPRYFLEIEVAYQKRDLLLSQMKYTLDLLVKTGILGCKPASALMEANMNLWCDNNLLDDNGQYRRLIGKLIYLTVTRPDITFTAGVLCWFMHQLRKIHWTTALRILAYIKSSPGKGLLYKKHEYIRILGYFDSGYVGDKGDRKFTAGYCTFVGGNLVTWSKKQDIVSRSSIEAKYRVMTHTTCEMMWLENLLLEFSFRHLGLVL